MSVAVSAPGHGSEVCLPWWGPCQDRRPAECSPARAARKTFGTPGPITGPSGISSMRPFGHRGDDCWTSFAHRRGIANTPRLGLDLAQTKAGPGAAADSPHSYPSPPMSGSPPLPPQNSREVAEQGQGTYRATIHNVYPTASTAGNEERAQVAGADGSRVFLSNPPDRASYALPPIEVPGAGSLLYSHPPSQGGAAQPPVYLPAPGTGTTSNHPGSLPSPQTYAPAAQRPITDFPPNTQSRSQRKTKGHVASACVPCKKAHLRCDGM
ncbi:uncharacterized protein P884DRAFT_45449 [Thermothelomyces heterothallicus CBS 202.75]|uniref:uncharacterized protein n=1 Tax=Thermothelomyces heterothallicus CBS 202.75 TaxID=1149848 RepID=UPI0037443337